MSKDIKVKITTYQNVLIIHTIEPKKDDNFIPAGNGKIGCVLIDTKKYLGISKEAFDLLKTIKRGGSAIGDVDSWEFTDEKKRNPYVFGWLGGINSIKEPDRCEGSRTYYPEKIPHVKIENNVNIDVKKAIDTMLKKASA